MTGAVAHDAKSMLNRLHDSLWEMERPLKAPGLRVGHRMTVARLASGDLWVHSPVQFDESIVRALIALGSPAHFVAPSTQHDLHWPEWFRRFPQAMFYCAPGVKEEHPNLPFQRALSTTTSEAWESELPKFLIRGIPKLNEFVFLHRSSRTLIVADLVFNFDVGQQHLLGKLFLKLNGIYGGVGCSRIFRRFVTDRKAFINSIAELLKLDFDRLLVGHGGVVEKGAKESLRKALAVDLASQRAA
jgi:Domain of unknown function (DUF4336)